MLPKKNRVDRKTLEKIFKGGRSVHGSGLSLKFIKSGTTATRFSFVVPKSVAKGAITRNSLRRRGYTALKKQFSHFPSGLNGVFIFKKNLASTEIENEIKNILDKIN